jgi:hypothetical protein
MKKKIGVVVFLLSIVLMASAFQANQGKKVATNEECFTVTLNSKGVIAADPYSMEVHWRNDCTTKMDLKYAFSRRDGTWNIATRYDIAPNAEVKASCENGTGGFRIWARPSSQSSTIIFPSDDDIRSGKVK